MANTSKPTNEYGQRVDCRRRFLIHGLSLLAPSAGEKLRSRTSDAGPRTAATEAHAPRLAPGASESTTMSLAREQFRHCAKPALGAWCAISWNRGHLHCRDAPAARRRPDQKPWAPGAEAALAAQVERSEPSTRAPASGKAENASGKVKTSLPAGRTLHGRHQQRPRHPGR